MADSLTEELLGCTLKDISPPHIAAFGAAAMFILVGMGTCAAGWGVDHYLRRLGDAEVEKAKKAGWAVIESASAPVGATE